MEAPYFVYFLSDI